MNPLKPAIFPRTVPSDPWTAARLLRGQDGFVFLDSQTPEDGSISVLGCRPENYLKGNIANSGDLERWESGGSSEGAVDLGIPTGGLLGAVDFDGQYTFGDYADLLVYRFSGGEWVPPANDVWERVCGRCENPSIRAQAPSVSFQSEMGKDEFCKLVERAQDYITAGDIYQVNLARQFVAPWKDGGDAFPLYERLADCSPAPYAAFLDLDGRQILSSSPECYLRMSGRAVVTRPIKGTRPRFLDPERDENAICELVTSPKEAAELVMITDLERNDLGQICDFGSVQVTELLKLESFAQVHHLVSTVRGLLRKDISHSRALAACFPGGSISGAPKRRALEIIEELEPVSRGLYTGAIGYLGRNGESQFSIAIRTAVIEGEEAHFHVGAGIVSDSCADMEFEETNHKAAGLLAAAHGSFQ